MRPIRKYSSRASLFSDSAPLFLSQSFPPTVSLLVVQGIAYRRFSVCQSPVGRKIAQGILSDIIPGDLLFLVRAALVLEEGITMESVSGRCEDVFSGRRDRRSALCLAGYLGGHRHPPPVIRKAPVARSFRAAARVFSRSSVKKERFHRS